MLNNCTFIGRIVADPELKETQSGTAVTSFCIAVERDFAKQGEERQADFIDIVAWRQTAEFVTRYFRKGSFIAIQGSLQVRNYTDKNENKRKAYEIIADKVSFCGAKSTGDVESRPRQNTQQYESGNDFQSDDVPNDDDSLPF